VALPRSPTAARKVRGTLEVGRGPDRPAVTRDRGHPFPPVDRVGLGRFGEHAYRRRYNWLSAGSGRIPRPPPAGARPCSRPVNSAPDPPVTPNHVTASAPRGDHRPRLAHDLAYRPVPPTRGHDCHPRHPFVQPRYLGGETNADDRGNQATTTNGRPRSRTSPPHPITSPRAPRRPRRNPNPPFCELRHRRSHPTERSVSP